MKEKALMPQLKKVKHSWTHALGSLVNLLTKQLASSEEQWIAGYDILMILVFEKAHYLPCMQKS